MKKVLIITAYDNESNESLHHKLLMDAIFNYSDITIRNLNNVHNTDGFDVAEEQVQLMLADVVIFQFPVINEKVSRLIPKYFKEVFESNFAFSQDQSHLSIHKRVGLISIVEGEKIPMALCKGVLLKPVEKIINECDWDLCGSMEIISNDQCGFCRVSQSGTAKMRPTGKGKEEVYMQFLADISQTKVESLV